MLESRVEHLKQAHSFGDWRGRSRSGRSLFVDGFRFTGSELPDLSIDRVVNVGTAPAPPAARRPLVRSSWQRATYGEPPERRVEERIELPPQTDPLRRVPAAPPIARSLWRAADPSSELSVVVIERDSREEAQEGVLELLASFESTRFESRDDLELGDVCFALPAETAAVFSRGNLTVLVRNAASEVQAVTDAARTFDTQVAADPEPAPPEAGVEVRALAAEAETLTVGEEIPLHIEAAVSRPEAVAPGMYKLFTPSGEVLRREGRLLYRPERAGRQDVTAYLLDPEGRGARRRIRPMAQPA